MRGQPLNDESMHPVLAELPVFAPGADLWSRIAAAHADSRRVQRPRYRWAAIAAVVAVAIGAATIVPLLQRGSGLTESPSGLAEGQRESQTLEREWQALSPASTRPAAGLARLHVIDTALQSAYDRGARADELQPLWKQRNDALRGLILSVRTDTITRI
jgi:hypothetical protein